MVKAELVQIHVQLVGEQPLSAVAMAKPGC